MIYKDKLFLKSELEKVLNKLNDGNKIFTYDIEKKDLEVYSCIDILYQVDNFPFDNTNENIYAFINSTKNIFTKYQIQDIVDILVYYQETNTTNIKDPSNVITLYVENHNNDSENIESIIERYVNNKNDKDSKSIKQLISDYSFRKSKLNQKEFHNTLLKYATDKEHQSNIANIIENIYKYKTLYDEIQAIIKEPRRDDKKYEIISSYEAYELTHCISYEMAIRNQEVIILLSNIKNLTILSKKLYEYYHTFGDVNIEENPYFDLKNTVEKAFECLDSYNIKHDINIKFSNFKLLQTHASAMQVITHLIIILEEEYYMIYDQKEIIPEGMEDVFDEPNHHEPDIELNSHMEKVIRKDPNYIDNYAKEDGYAIYQGSYNESKSYEMNKIKPNFKRPMREFNQTEVAFNMSLPKNEILAYIEKIKDDYDNKSTSYKTLNKLLYSDDKRTDEKLKHKGQDRYADDFFIFDYYTQSDQEDEEKLDMIQKRLSQYHGMKIEEGRNNYKLIKYDEAQVKISTSKIKMNKSNSFDDFSKVFKNHNNIIHYIETVKIIKKKYKILKSAIDNKKYKKLMNHE